jgi:hypothetical protein
MGRNMGRRIELIVRWKSAVLFLFPLGNCVIFVFSEPLSVTHAAPIGARRVCSAVQNPEWKEIPSISENAIKQ